MKKFIITLLCLAIVAGGSWFGYTKFQQNKDEKRIVDVVPVSSLNQEYYNEDKVTDARVTSGSIQNVELSTQKLIKQVCVQLGDKVKKGDILLIYDMTVVDLENEKNKNQLAVIDQEIKEQEKELKRLQSLQPAENAPKDSSADSKKDVTTTTSAAKTTTTKKTTTKKTTTTTTTKPEMIKPVSKTTTTKATTRKTKTQKPEPQPVTVRSELKTIENPDGYELDGSITFRCADSTVVTADFMQQLIDNSQHCILYVYDSEHRRIQYFWDIDPLNNVKIEAYDWRVDDGVISNHGSYAYNGPGDLKNGVFYVYIEPDDPDDGYDDGYDDYDDFADNADVEGEDVNLPDDGGDENIDLPDVTQKPDEEDPGSEDLPDPSSSDDRHVDVDLSDESGSDDSVKDTESLPDAGDESDADEEKKPEDENYKYTRADLAERIKEAQIALKEKQLEYRKADLVYQQGLKQKADGNVVAQIDGIVTRLDEETTTVGAVMGYGDGESEDGYEYEENYEEMMDFGGDYEEIDDGMGMDGVHPYITIQGKATVSLDINVPELSLSKFPKGTVVSGTNYNTGEDFTAVVTGRKDDPISYRGGYDSNPNSSVYVVTADVKDCPNLIIDQYVTIKIPQTEVKRNENSLFLPLTYLRKEGSSYYVMLADGNGLLKKRYVKTGKIHYGEIIEVLGGLTIDDRVCFPYGKDVKEGVKTRDSNDIVW